MTNFKIDVVSDPICPWCYIGKGRLEKAIDAYKKVVPNGDKDTFTVTWHPFYLDPTLPKQGSDPDVHLARKFGAERVKAINARMKQLGASEGLPFQSRGYIGNTRDAHRLLQLARRKGTETQNRVVAELFRAHFEGGGDITSREMLAGAAAAAGLDRAEAEAWLAEGKGGDDVDREVDEAYAKGIHGVPNFTVNGRYELEGAQDPETFLQTFVRAKAAAAPDVSSGSAETC